MEARLIDVSRTAEDPVDQAARGVGRAIALEVGYSHTVDERALATARSYATMAGDSLGRNVRCCLRYGNAAAAAFDSMILEFAIVAIVTTFRCWSQFERPLVALAIPGHDSRSDRGKKRRPARWLPRSDRRVWRGRIS